MIFCLILWVSAQLPEGVTQTHTANMQPEKCTGMREKRQRIAEVQYLPSRRRSEFNDEACYIVIALASCCFVSRTWVAFSFLMLRNGMDLCGTHPSNPRQHLQRDYLFCSFKTVCMDVVFRKYEFAIQNFYFICQWKVVWNKNHVSFFGRMETDHFSITIKNLAIVPFFKKNGSIRILAEYIAVLRI